MFQLDEFRFLIFIFMQLCCYLPINYYKPLTLTPMVPSHSTLSALIKFQIVLTWPRGRLFSDKYAYIVRTKSKNSR